MNVFLGNKMNVLLTMALTATLAISSPVWAEDPLSNPPKSLIKVSDISEVANTTSNEAESFVEQADEQSPLAGGLGDLTVNEAQMPADLWQNISEEKILDILNDWPATIKSPSLRHLLMRALLVETVRADLTEAVIMARSKALLSMGQPILARKLLQVVPDSLKSSVIEEETFLLGAFIESSQKSQCKFTSDRQISYPQPFWQRFQVLCLAKSKERSKALLGLELLREQNNATDLFASIVNQILENTEADAKTELSKLNREELAWLVVANKLPEIPNNLSLERAALLAANGKIKNKAIDSWKAFGINKRSITSPNDSSPDVALSLMKLRDDSSTVKVRRALLAFSIRRLWEKPVSVETEKALLNKHFFGDAKQLSPAWREQSALLQDNEEKLPALLALLKPLTDVSSVYTIHDLTFVMHELKAMGLVEDAVAFAEESLKSE